MMPMRSEIRAPYTTRLKTSRPMVSVPNQCSAEGDARTSMGLGISVGL